MTYNENNYSYNLELESPLIEPEQVYETYTNEDEYHIESDCNCHEVAEETFLPLTEDEYFYDEANIETHEVDDSYEDYWDSETADIIELDEDEWLELESEDIYEDHESEFYSDNLDLEFIDFEDSEDWIDEVMDDEFDMEEEKDSYNSDISEYNELSNNENESYGELEEAFIFGLDNLKKLWDKTKNALNPTTTLPTVAPNGDLLKLPIVSTSLPDSSNYKKYKNSQERYFGVPETIEALKWIGKEWVNKHPEITFGIGDISQMGGGKISGHASHRMGIDADVKLIDKGKIISSNSSNFKDYRKYVRDFISIVKRNPFIPIVTIGFQDSQLISEFRRLVRPWKGHASHLHLRFCIPPKRLSKQDITKVYGNQKIGGYKFCDSGNINYVPINIQPQKKVSTSINTNAAISYNNRKMMSLGWAKYKSKLNILLGLTSRNPSDSEFVLAVAAWQKINGFHGNDIDGKIGPSTWRKMKSKFGNKISSTQPSAAPITATNSNSNNQVSKKTGGWGGWRGKSSRSTTRVSSNLINDNFDIAIAVASSAEGSYDIVNMYDKGIISWGIKQWTIHAGSLQGLLEHIKNRLHEKGLSQLWNQLFPGINITNKVLSYNGVKYATSNKLGLMKLFRGTTSKVNYDEKTINKWIDTFAIAGRNSVIQELQFEYAKVELKKLLNRNLGTILSSLRKCKNSNKGWCKTVKKFNNFNPSYYGQIGKYIENRGKAMALFNGMHTQNPVWTYIYLKRAVDEMISNHNTSNTKMWPKNWQNEMENILVRLFTASGVACWGTQAINSKSNCKGRTSRTQKLLNTFNKFRP